MSYTIFIAINLQYGIIPDEERHLTFAKHFATTWGIPQDTYKTYSVGWYIKNNPFLYHWLMGRVINLITYIHPEVTGRQILVTLRVVNAGFALGTVIFCFLLSKEVIRHKWWQLLPVFLLTNTLMFVFLSGGLNYDNLANLFCMMGLYSLVRVMNKGRFLENSLAWMISIALGTLVKFTILPLALAMCISWLIYVIVHRKAIFPIRINHPKKILLIIVLVILFTGNFAIYGMNLIRYSSLTTPCRQILSEAQCQISPFAVRHREYALDKKLTIQESIRLGYPNPFIYATWIWVREIIVRSFGIYGHQSYLPYNQSASFRFLFYWMIILSNICLINRKKLSFISIVLILISLFYAITLMIKNYYIDLTYGFIFIALQGRYIFPVIGLIFILYAKILQNVPFLDIKAFTIIASLILFFYKGPLTFIIKYTLIFNTWFIK